MGWRRTGSVVATVLLVAAGCGDDGTDRAGSRPRPSASPTPVDTPELDAIAVIGHSGATGTGTDPDSPRKDARENSWATGDNPAVRSIYTQLLATHPALEGHQTDLAVNGSTVDDHLDQAVAAMRLSPVPDVVLLQTIDNDERCDGTDAEHVSEFAAGLAEVIRTVVEASATAQVYVVSQWGSIDQYAATIRGEPSAVSASSGDGPCALFDSLGRPSRSGRKSLQQVIDLYWNVVERTCARFSRCFTDGGAMAALDVELADLTADYNHLSVAGQRKFAALAWSALPPEIRDRP